MTDNALPTGGDDKGEEDIVISIRTGAGIDIDTHVVEERTLSAAARAEILAEVLTPYRYSARVGPFN